MTRRSGSFKNLGCYCSNKLRVIYFFVLFNLMIMKLYSNYWGFFICISILLLFFQTLFLVCLCKKIVHMYFFVTILSCFIFYFWYDSVKNYISYVFVILLLLYQTLSCNQYICCTNIPHE